ncbi:hypothetical protein ACLKA7_002217 [Drosophila subpalustris]
MTRGRCAARRSGSLERQQQRQHRRRDASLSVVGDLYFAYVSLSVSKLLTVDNARRLTRTVVNNDDGNASLLSTQSSVNATIRK